MNHFHRFFPWFVMGVAALYLFMMMETSAPGASTPGVDLEEFGKVPILDGGRIKPLDTYARITLMLISRKQTFKDENDKTQPAIKWFLDLATRHPRMDDYKVFSITNDQVLAFLGLDQRSGFRYAYNEFEKKIPALKEMVEKAMKVTPKDRNRYEGALVELFHHLRIYHEISRGWESTLLLVPPREGGPDWITFRQAASEADDTEKGQLLHMARALRAYSSLTKEKEGGTNDPQLSAIFNTEVGKYLDQIHHQVGKDVRMVGFETTFNNFAPFTQCAYLYAVVFLLSCIGWLVWTEPLTRAAFWLAVLILAVHTWALVARMVIQGRPPVTNLYSSAVFIGWGCVVLGLGLEVIFRNGLGNVVASVAGGLTMLIAHHLAESGDTLEMMQAVLDTNFWLATHVTCVTFGYVATFVAGLLGILYILGGVFTTSLTKANSKALGQMIYGVVCFATLLSFVGTVLGGIWADYSWGRFWGWDPKENGALLIVIVNALILHARWGGMVRERGMAVLTLCGFMVMMWSWFGTNQLGVGLHAYGFNNTLALVCTGVWGLNLGLIGIGLMPMNYWRSFNRPLQPPPSPQSPPPPPPSPQKPGPKGKGGRSSTGVTKRR